MRGIILRGYGGFYYALGEDGQTHTLRAQNKLRRGHNRLLTGDRVELTPGEGDEEGWITEILPRRTELVRPPVANIELIVFVAAPAAPKPDLTLFDKLLLAARLGGIGVKLVVNKADVDAEFAARIARQYAKAGVDPLIVCARDGAGIPALRESLKGKIFVFAGQSGVGKSTLVNALFGLTRETGDLSWRVERGKNTTRYSELIPVPGGGMALDTPGFSLLDAPLIEPILLKDSYPEFEPYEGKCFFAPCAHATEPKCAVRDAVARGEIDAERHARYVALLEDMKIRWRERYD